MKNKSNPNTIIRSTFHHFRKETNTGKLNPVNEFVQAYREAVYQCVNYIWDLKLEWGKKGETQIWDREHDLLDCPPMISTTEINYEGPLSARALKCAATQACGIVKAVTDKRQKDLNKKAWLESRNKKPGKGLLKRINKGLTKPDCKDIGCELNSICMDVQFENGKYFDGFINLKSLWNKESKYPRGYSVKIPVKHYRRSNKWKEMGVSKPSILLTGSSVTLRWEVPKPLKKIEGKVIAIDQGKLVCLTSSDGQKSLKDIHGHNLASIIGKMVLKRWGSKGFKKTAEHRKNYINWAVKKLDLRGVKEVKLEDIENINYGRNVSRSMKHWINTLIRDSLSKGCEEAGVLFTLTPNEFNSQRCHECGWVQKSNRQGKHFKCKMCGYEGDADFNAAQNILIRDTLFDLSFGFRQHRLNLRGFYWKPEGLFDGCGQELTVPVGSENS